VGEARIQIICLAPTSTAVLLIKIASTSGDRQTGAESPHVLRAMTNKRAKDVHFGVRGRGAKIGPL
jgi:hypothetical protein